MNYLNAEKLIIDCLKAEIETISPTKILSAVDIDGVKSKNQINPAIQVILYDDQPEEAAGGELNSQFVHQLWLTMVVVRNVRHESGKGARVDAGEIISDVISILNGKHLKAPYSRMIRIKSPYRPTYINGFFYFPIMFKVRMKTTGRERYTKPL